MIIPELSSRKRSQGKTYTDTSFYRSSVWRSLRARKLQLNPNCFVCGSKGTVVDHINRIEAGGEKLDMNNLQTMCDHCHNQKRAREKNEKYKK